MSTSLPVHFFLMISDFSEFCFFFFFPSVLGIEPRALHLLGKHPTIELATSLRPRP
jgi:hypothetical protein